jgi:hypothetical protein
MRPSQSESNAEERVEAESVSAGALAGTRLLVAAPGSLPDEEVGRVVEMLAAGGFGGVSSGTVDISITRSNVRYFHAEDEPAAERVQALLRPDFEADVRAFTHFSPAPPPGTVELWLAGDAVSRSAGATRSATAATVRRVAPASGPAANGTDNGLAGLVGLILGGLGTAQARGEAGDGDGSFPTADSGVVRSVRVDQPTGSSGTSGNSEKKQSSSGRDKQTKSRSTEKDTGSSDRGRSTSTRSVSTGTEASKVSTGSEPKSTGSATVQTGGSSQTPSNASTSTPASTPGKTASTPTASPATGSAGPSAGRGVSPRSNGWGSDHGVRSRGRSHDRDHGAERGGGFGKGKSGGRGKSGKSGKGGKSGKSKGGKSGGRR